LLAWSTLLWLTQASSFVTAIGAVSAHPFSFTTYPLLDVFLLVAGAWLGAVGWIAHARRNGISSRTGAWALFWIAPIVATTALGSFRGELPLLATLPVAFAGLIALQGRWFTLAITALVVSTAGSFVVHRNDPEREWRLAAEEQLDPDDVVVTESAVHAYLLRERYGLAAVSVSPPPASSPHTSPPSTSTTNRAANDTQLTTASVSGREALDALSTALQRPELVGRRVVIDAGVGVGWMSDAELAELARLGTATSIRLPR